MTTPAQATPRQNMKTGIRKTVAIATLALALVACALLMAWKLSRVPQGTVTTAALSPDGRIRAVLVELPRPLDRNFEIRLEATGDASPQVRTIFSSPDEGRPIGSERFVWSQDSRWLLLVGKHFFTRQDAHLASGEHLYFLYDLNSGEARCNSSQQDTLPPFQIDDLKGIGFGRQLGRLKEPGDTANQVRTHERDEIPRPGQGTD